MREWREGEYGYGSRTPERGFASGPSDAEEGPASQSLSRRCGKASAGGGKAEERQAAGMGKLQEVDLGPSATRRNIVRTELAARRRVEGRPASAETAPDARHQGASRVRGRMRRGRCARRKTSEELRRELLVEQVLQESKRT